LFLKKIIAKSYKNKTKNSKETLKLLKLIFSSPAQMNGKVNFDRFYVMIILRKGPFTCFVIKWTLQKQRHLAVSFDFYYYYAMNFLAHQNNNNDNNFILSNKILNKLVPILSKVPKKQQ